MTPLMNLEDLFVHHLRDLHNAERQILKALPKMARAASSDDLRNGFEEHREQTAEHVERLDTVLESLGHGTRGRRCMGMEGLIEEGAEILEEDAEPSTRDAGLIAAAQKVEHYEIAAYGTAVSYARRLGHTKAAELLQLTLDEEKETDAKLTALAESQVNAEAAA